MTLRVLQKPIDERGGRLMARLLATAVATTCLVLPFVSAQAAEATVKPDNPARVETITKGGATVKKMSLTPKAAERLGVQIDEVRVDPSGRRIVPYSSIFYDLNGGTWVYVHTDPMSFVRETVKIDTIKGENVYLNDGPPPGAKVLATGVPQIFGIEMGVGH
jgi:hypothetical protein